MRFTLNRNIVYFVLFVVVIAGLLFAGKTLSHRSNAVDAAVQQPGSGSASGEEDNLSVARDFSLSVIGGGGKTMKLSDLKGKAVLVNFWATYCGPCKLEMPSLIELQKKYGPEGLQIVGIANDDAGEKEILDFAHKMGVNYPILQGTNEVGDEYRVSGLPTSFFIDRSGNIVHSQLGIAEAEDLARYIRQSLDHSPAQKAVSAK